ncbi:hypothetical protein Tco_0352756 [Tanacetum coccineum]
MERGMIALDDYDDDDDDVLDVLSLDSNFYEGEKMYGLWSRRLVHGKEGNCIWLMAYDLEAMNIRYNATDSFSDAIAKLGILGLQYLTADLYDVRNFQTSSRFNLDVD